MARLSPDADLIDVVEAAYAQEPDDNRWALGLSQVVQRSLLAASHTGAAVVAHGEDFVEPTPVFHVCTDDALGKRMAGMFGSVDDAAFSPGVVRTFYPGHPFYTHAELEKRVTPEIAGFLRMGRAGAPDACAFFSYPAPGVAVLLWSLLGRIDTYARGELSLLYCLASHIDGAFRLRVSPEAAVLAVLSPRGELLDLEDRSLESQREALTARLRSIERSRTTSVRKRPDALQAWHALIDGRYSVVPREDVDGKRHYLLVENGLLSRDHARLSKREIDVVTYAARGYGGKQTAHSLGLHESAVSSTLLRAARKLGLRSRSALVQVAGALFGVPSESLNLRALSPAELDVLELLRRGLTNAEIASLRTRSTHTVANQISSILKKTGRSSRRLLLTPA